MAYFLSRDPAESIIISKKCDNCSAEHYLSFAALTSKNTKSKRLLFKNILESKFISFTNETIYEISLLQNFTSQLLYNHSSFAGFCSAFNHQFKTLEDYIFNNGSRKVLNPRRFTETWYYYRLLFFHLEFNTDLSNFEFGFVYELDNKLQNLKSSMLPHFVKKWSGKEIVFEYNCIIQNNFNL